MKERMRKHARLGNRTRKERWRNRKRGLNNEPREA